MNEKQSGLNLYSNLLRPLLFRLNAETAHHGTVEACRWLGAMPGACRACENDVGNSHPNAECRD